MAIIDEIGTAWSDAVTLTDPEFWQVQRGLVRLATQGASAPADLNDGILLAEGDVIALEAGEVVRYRSATGFANAAIVRRARVA